MFFLVFVRIDRHHRQVHEARSKSRNSLKVVGASRHVLGNRSVQLATFLDNCSEEEAVLELQVC